ncbi:MAG: hypothetical protein KF850_29880 [Labilithrix sp.]|nr:hypothetical protein [Labilithrix sp.]MBX3216287.1 hypothetical protein [Labilithrix sp.]
MSLRRLSVVVSIALSGACTLLIDTDDLDAGPAPIAPADDAGDTGPSASSTDARTDGGALEDADAGPGSPCAEPHAFCDDFDDGSDDLAARWDSLKTQAGPVSIATDRWVSAPRALRAVVAPHTATLGSALQKVVAIPNGKVNVEVDLHVEHTDGSWVEVDPVEIILRPGPPGYDHHSLYLILHQTEQLFLYYAPKTDGGYDIRTQSASFAMGSWQHLVFTFESSPARATLAIDGVTVPLDTFAGPTVTSLELGVGAAYTENVTNDWKITLDNVVVDTP